MALEHDETSQEQDSTVSVGDDGTGIGDGTDGSDLSGVLGSGDGGGFVSDEKKKPLNTGTLVMAGFLLACGVGTYVMYTRNAPANTGPSADTTAAQTTITQFLSDDKQNVSKMKDLLQNTEKAVEQFRAAPAKTQVPLEALQTNPFRFGPATPDGAPADDDAATKKKAEEARAATLKAAQALNLQFIVVGKKKSCLINNGRYLEGQQVGEFTIESISPNAVVISKDDARFELKMKK
jgi:preprotein translocase subunit SecG